MADYRPDEHLKGAIDAFAQAEAFEQDPVRTVALPDLFYSVLFKGRRCARCGTVDCKACKAR